MEQSTIFPDLSKVYPESMEEQAIELNGQKVLFDKKVSLMPVELDKKDQVSKKKKHDR